MRPSCKRELHIKALALALLLNSAGAVASTCAPVSSGYVVGPQVRYFQEDRSAQPPVRQEQGVRGAEPRSFEPVRHPVYDSGPCAGRRVEYGRDHQHVYYQWKVVPGADPQTYSFLDANYARDRTAIYAFAKRLTTRVDQFRILGGGYAGDGRQHFYQDIVIQGPGFELLGGPAYSDRAYARTARRVYHQGQVLPQADAPSFELFKPEVGITRDKRAVYFDGQVIQGADPKSFEQVYGTTFKDRGGVYTEGQRLAGIDPASVRATEFGSYLVDAFSVFKAGRRLPGRDPASFAELQPAWSRDKNAAYFRDTAVPGIDLASFKTTALNRAEDRHHRFDGAARVCKFSKDEASALPLCN